MKGFDHFHFPKLSTIRLKFFRLKVKKKVLIFFLISLILLTLLKKNFFFAFLKLTVDVIAADGFQEIKQFIKRLTVKCLDSQRCQKHKSASQQKGEAQDKEHQPADPSMKLPCCEA